MDRTAEDFVRLGATHWAAEAAAQAAAAQAAVAHRAAGHGAEAARSVLRSAELAGECGGLRTPAILASSAGAKVNLTRRESEVARLAASGRSDRAIADDLFVSVRTVESHLHNAYRKLGISSRADLAAFPDI